MPRTCRACASPDRVLIDSELASGRPLRNIAKRVSISPAGLLRHKRHLPDSALKASKGCGVRPSAREVVAKVQALGAELYLNGNVIGLRASNRKQARAAIDALEGYTYEEVAPVLAEHTNGPRLA